jgi:hypothetical protein
MDRQLPESVARFFALCNGQAGAGVATCFVDDAVVTDERRTHRGVAEIESWLREARAAFDYTSEPAGIEPTADGIRVQARVVGNFPGSPVNLAHDFVLAGDGRIERLDIH